MTPRQGEIWWAETVDQRRPVLVVSRSSAAGILETVVVAPVTRTVRGIPSEVRLGAEDGLAIECAASFDNLQVARRSSLTDLVGDIGHRRHELCAALAAMADC